LTHKTILSSCFDKIFTIFYAGYAVNIDTFQVGQFSWQLLHRAPGNQKCCYPPNSKNEGSAHRFVQKTGKLVHEAGQRAAEETGW